MGENVLLRFQVAISVVALSYGSFRVARHFLTDLTMILDESSIFPTNIPIQQWLGSPE